MTNLTIESYERDALDYAAQIGDFPPPVIEGALLRLVEAIPPGGRVLEVGSGTGRDADFIESCGESVRRTDATRAFRGLQVARGKQVEPLDVIRDDLGGPYDGILALCVFIHVDRDSTLSVLRKVAAALRPAGAFLVSVREGSGETNGAYLMSYWDRAEYDALLAEAGLRVDWDQRHTDCDGDTWLTFLARKAH
ncbi:methyltransferase domain-containing protein [Streptomyces sp. SID13031]|uniref:methyltransferase domain-containing protein n=1 Tax=Streptomyces sp. SID13031 TaxID=2706046 RepID=UPI0013CDD37A|nr:methyltransferase domain-containing protein [Streptomyces sp. SID13031]NEA31245.1 class I SAM-dependent methyltransferase [Streptomyces sp. SID13031]